VDNAEFIKIMHEKSRSYIEECTHVGSLKENLQHRDRPDASQNE
jgi:hypothetical protein